MENLTIADFVEVNAHNIFTLSEHNAIVIDDETQREINQRLQAIFSTPHVLTAIDSIRGLIIPGGKYKLTNRRNIHARDWLIIEDANNQQGFGEYCIPLTDFINAFVDSDLPNHEE